MIKFEKLTIFFYGRGKSLSNKNKTCVSVLPISLQKLLQSYEKLQYKRKKFQRIARRHKKAFFSDQCKEIEEKNRMGKIRDLFRKIRDTKGTFHAKVVTRKDIKGMDLTEAQYIKKWQEYTEELYKKRSS